MTVKTGTAWAGLFVTLDATGAKATPTSGPAGVLYIDGVADAATVTITGSNPYKWSVTLPSLTAGQRVDMYITATISSIATAGVVASEQADTSLVSEVKTETAAILADTGTDGVVIASAQTVATVTNLTNLPAATADWLTANAVKADAVTKIQNGLAQEATLTAIKGAGWSTETLFAIGANVADTLDNSSTTQETIEAIMGVGWSTETLKAIKASIDAILADTGTDGVVLKAAGLDADAVAEIADGVLDEAMSGHTSAGTLGKAVADVLADTNELQTDWANGGRLDLILDSASAPSASDVADAVLDEAMSGHVSAGSLGKAVADILTDTGTDIPAAIPSASDIDTQLSGTHGAGSWLSPGSGGALAITNYPVTDSVTGLPVAGAVVELYQTDDYTGMIDCQVTGASGLVTFSNLAAGEYYLKIVRTGYEAAYDTEVAA